MSTLVKIKEVNKGDGATSVCARIYGSRVKVPAGSTVGTSV